MAIEGGTPKVDGRARTPNMRDTGVAILKHASMRNDGVGAFEI